MITLIERMRQELVRRNYAATTIRSYLKAVEHFQQHISMPLEAIGPDDIRSIEDVDYQHPRGLDRKLLRTLASSEWVKQHQNLLLIGPTDPVTFCTPLLHH